MNKLLQTKLNLPAWLFGVAIFAQLLMLLLTGRVIWEQKRPPTSWAIDSTTYYKNLYQQGKLNYTLYNNQQDHEKRLQKLGAKRQAQHRHIDSLSGDALQREIDRQYNGSPVGAPRQPYPVGPKTNPADGSGGTAGAEGQSRSDHAARRGQIPGYVVGAATSGYYDPRPDDSAVEPAPAAGPQRRADGKGAGRRLPEEVARSETGKLGLSNRPGTVRSRSFQTNLTYWQRIRAQGYTYPDIAFAISAVETGYWWIPPPGHNLFGMKKNPRQFYSSVSAGGYCLYETESASLADYGAYEQFVIAKYGLQSRTAYLAHICRRFCPNPSYRGKLDLAFQKLAALRPLS